MGNSALISGSKKSSANFERAIAMPTASPTPPPIRSPIPARHSDDTASFNNRPRLAQKSASAAESDGRNIGSTSFARADTSQTMSTSAIG